MGLALGFPTLTPNPQPHLLLLSCKTIKAWALPCLAASTPGNTLREMSTAGTGNSTEPLLGRGLGRPAGRQEQNLKGRECERAEDMAQWHTACHGCLRSPPSAQDQKEEKRKKTAGRQEAWSTELGQAGHCCPPTRKLFSSPYSLSTTPPPWEQLISHLPKLHKDTRSPPMALGREFRATPSTLAHGGRRLCPLPSRLGASRSRY